MRKSRLLLGPQRRVCDALSNCDASPTRREEASLTDCSAPPSTSFPSTHIRYVSFAFSAMFVKLQGDVWDEEEQQ